MGKRSGCGRQVPALRQLLSTYCHMWSLGRPVHSALFPPHFRDETTPEVSRPVDSGPTGRWDRQKPVLCAAFQVGLRQTAGRGRGGSSSLDILADLALQPLPPLLQLLDGAFLWELVRGASELTLSQ